MVGASPTGGTGSPVATGGFGGLSPPNKALRPPKLERETQYISGVMVNFITSSPPHKCKAPPQNCKAPYWKLSGNGSGYGAALPRHWDMI